MKIFISYAKEDVEFARRLYNDLIKIPQVAPWLDEKQLLPGSYWQDEIFNAIDQSQFVIVLLSTRSVQKTGFIQKEFRKAIDRLGYYPPEKIFIIPARIDNCIPQHQELMKVQWVDLFPDWDLGIKKIILSIGAKKVTHRYTATGSDKGGKVKISDLSDREIQGITININLEEIPFLNKKNFMSSKPPRRYGLALDIMISLWDKAQDYPNTLYRKNGWTRLDNLIFVLDRTAQNFKELERIFRREWALAKEMPGYEENDWILFKRIIEDT